MRKLRMFSASLLPIVGVVLAFAALAQAAPSRQEGAEPAETSSCIAQTLKLATPEKLLLGGTVQVTLVYSHTCPNVPKPVDIMFLVDESNSMSRAEGGSGADPGEPTPGGSPPPSKTEPAKTPFPDLMGFMPAQGPGDPGDPGGGIGRSDDPAGCESGLSVPPGPGDPPPTDPPPGPGPGPLVEAALGSVMPEQVPPTRPSKTEPPPPTFPPGKETPVPTSPPGGGNDPGDDDEPAGSEDLIREVQAWLREFIDEPRIEQDIRDGNMRLGMVSFNTRARTLLKLSTEDRALRLGTYANRLRPQGKTRIDMGWQRAITEMNRKGPGIDSPLGRNRYVVILSDGAICKRDMRRVRETKGIKVVTVSFGRSGWERRLDQLASEGRWAFEARDYRSFMDRYEAELASSTAVFAEQLEIRDTLQSNMRLVPGSVLPEPSSVVDRRIAWDAHPPGSPITTTPRITIAPRITLTYSVEPLEAGLSNVSEQAFARWRDSQSLPGEVEFPAVLVDVLAPTPTFTPEPTSTPTPTFTPSPTPTEIPKPRYLPVLFNNWPEATPDVCTPEKQKVDVVLAIDTSTSMSSGAPDGSGTKLDAAIVASKALVDLLGLTGDGDDDQVSVVGFNSAASLLSPLSDDRAAVEAALDALPSTTAPGTAIDTGLAMAIDELGSERRRTGSTASIVLVTDGRHGGSDADVLAQAERARDLGLIVFAVGLGDDVDADLLRATATRPEMYRFAPDGSDLVLIYETIAKEIPCP